MAAAAVPMAAPQAGECHQLRFAADQTKANGEVIWRQASRQSVQEHGDAHAVTLGPPLCKAA